jgi:hypothetical protein
MEELVKRPRMDAAAAAEDPGSTGAVDPAGLAAMRLAVGPRDDCYKWCEAEGMFIDADHLLQLMDRAQQPGTGPLVLVVDTRDDDVAGGMVHGAIHAADGTFEAEGLAAVLEHADQLLKASRCAAAADTLTPIPPKVCVVFHCMESARRGPRCARRLHVYLQASQSPALSSQSLSLHVLKGGADQWIRRFFRDPSRTQGFDDDYWGFLFSDDDEDEDGGGEDDNEINAPVAPLHKLYQRPADQPATPWSQAGSDAQCK